MLKVGFAAEVLPIGILDPGPDELPISAGKGVLQVEQSGNEPWRTDSPSGLGWEEFRPARFEHGPIDQVCQFDQWMLKIDELQPRVVETNRLLPDVCLSDP